MGKTFSQPTYFYQDNTAPDLVDTNGPLYSRTAVNLGNVTPTSVQGFDRFFSTDGNLKSASSSELNVISHDLSVMSLPYSIMPNDSDSPITVVKLVGYITTTGGNYMETINSMHMLSFIFKFDNFPIETSFISSNVAGYTSKSTVPQVTGVAFPNYSPIGIETVPTLYAPMAFNAAADNDSIADYMSFRFVFA